MDAAKSTCSENITISDSFIQKMTFCYEMLTVTNICRPRDYNIYILRIRISFNPNFNG